MDTFVSKVVATMGAVRQLVRAGKAARHRFPFLIDLQLIARGHVLPRQRLLVSAKNGHSRRSSAMLTTGSSQLAE
jgi:hypothetical protein